MGGRLKREPQGEGGSRAGGGSRTYQLPHTPQHGQAERPIMPHFMEEAEPERESDLVADLVNSVASGINEYEGLDGQIKRVISFGEYIHLKERCTNRVGGHYRGGASNKDVQKLLGKITLPNFDGSAKSSARAWIQKLDTYFHLNPMREVDAIRFATLHLEGDA